MKKITIGIDDNIYEILKNAARSKKAKEEKLTIEKIAAGLMEKQLRYLAFQKFMDGGS